MQETQVWSPGQEDSLEKEMATHSIILAWRIPWTENPGRLQSMGSQKSWTWLSTKSGVIWGNIYIFYSLTSSLEHSAKSVLYHLWILVRGIRWKGLLLWSLLFLTTMANQLWCLSSKCQTLSSFPSPSHCHCLNENSPIWTSVIVSWWIPMTLDSFFSNSFNTT